MSYLLMTGATGLLGQYVLRNLLVGGERVAVIVRPGKTVAAADRIDAVLQHFEEQCGYSLPRPVVIPGDLRETEAGINELWRRWITGNCDRLLHSAASMTFRKDRHGEPFRTNVDGTRTLLELCRSCGIRQFHHVSTAYICGLREGRILETEVDLGQTLGNVYEESKLRAEKLVRSADCLDRVTIYRPASIVGDYQTGYVTNFHGFYLPLQLAHMMAPQVTVADMNERFLSSLGLKGDEGKNLVPVDWVAEAIAHVIAHRDLHGQTYHLASSTPVPVSAVQQAIQHAVERFHPNPLRETQSRVDLSAYESLFQQYMQVYESHWRNDPNFDLTQTRRALPHLPCPSIDEAALLRIARYPMERNFAAANFENCLRHIDIEQHVRSRIGNAQADATTNEERIGLQVNGHGGGQWQLVIRDGVVNGFESGLPEGERAQLYLNTATFQSLIQGESHIDDALACGRVLVQAANGHEADLRSLLQQITVA